MGLSDHLLDRLDTGDRFLGVRESKRNRTGQLAVDINGTSAHSLHHASTLQRSSAEPRQDDGLLWSDILEYAEDFDLELFDVLPVEDGPAEAVHTGANIAEREKPFGAGGTGKKREQQQDHRSGQSLKRYFAPRTEGGLTHVSHCLSELVQTSLCD